MRALMRPAAAVLALLGLAVLVWLWMGGLDALGRWAAGAQREVQDGMARALRALRAGQPGALAALIGVCFGYGFFHAVGPGHGKLVVGAYGLAQDVPLARLSLVAVAGSLMQGATAIVLVVSGVWLLGLTRTQMTQAGDAWLAPASYAAIALVGIWLALRGVLRLVRQGRPAAAQHHHHHHDHAHQGDGQDCAVCGHAHTPDPMAVARAKGLRETLALVAAIGLRPCTGALFLLILGFGMGLVPQAIAGTVAMALGTATVTLVVAGGSVVFRTSLAQAWGSGRGAASLAASIEIGAGLLVTLAALSLLSPFL